MVRLYRQIGKVPLPLSLPIPGLQQGGPLRRLRPVICPLSSLFLKKFRFALDPNQIYIHRRPVPLQGRIAIVTDAGRDAMDAAASGAKPDGRAGFP